MEINDVSVSSRLLDVDEIFMVCFKVVGAQPKPFEFPFSNESLTEKKIQFVKEG